MLAAIIAKLPMRDKQHTRQFYRQLGFRDIGAADYPDYLLMGRDGLELHFFSFPGLDPRTNYGQLYIRVKEIETLYATFLSAGVSIHPNAPLQVKPWGQKEFALIDPDHNLLTFGEASR